MCAKCDMPLIAMPIDTKRLDAVNNDILQLPSTGETRILSRVKLRFAIGHGPERIDTAIIDELIIGRSVPGTEGKPDVDLSAFVGPANEMGVSRSHCLIKRQGLNLVLLDLDSTNGTWVNGSRLIAGEPRFIHDGDTLWLARLQLSIFFVA